MNVTDTNQERRKLGYARCSSDRQTTEQQVEELYKAGCANVFVDYDVQATAKDRAALNDVTTALKDGDIFVVWAIDRAFRSTIEAIQYLDGLHKRDVDFLSLTQRIDTRTPEGRKWYIDTASWAEYERAIISRRTKAKMAYCKAQGKHMGRPFKLSLRQVKNAHKMVTVKNMDLKDVAHKYAVKPRTLERNFERLEHEVIRQN